MRLCVTVHRVRVLARRISQASRNRRSREILGVFAELEIPEGIASFGGPFAVSSLGGQIGL